MEAALLCLKPGCQVSHGVQPVRFDIGLKFHCGGQSFPEHHWLRLLYLNLKLGVIQIITQLVLQLHSQQCLVDSLTDLVKLVFEVLGQPLQRISYLCSKACSILW